MYSLSKHMLNSILYLQNTFSIANLNIEDLIRDSPPWVTFCMTDRLQFGGDSYYHHMVIFAKGCLASEH